MIRSAGESESREGARVATPSKVKTVYGWAVRDTESVFGYPVRRLGAVESGAFGFAVPKDFKALVSLEICGYAQSVGAVGAGKDINLNSSYGNPDLGEGNNHHDFDDSASTYTIPALNELFYIDIAYMFSDLDAGDQAGLTLGHSGIGGSIDWIGIILRYIAVES